MLQSFWVINDVMKLIDGTMNTFGMIGEDPRQTFQILKWNAQRMPINNFRMRFSQISLKLKSLSVGFAIAVKFPSEYYLASEYNSESEEKAQHFSSYNPSYRSSVNGKSDINYINFECKVWLL